MLTVRSAKESPTSTSLSLTHFCGYKIQPNERVRRGSPIVQCPKCGGGFDEMGGLKPISTS
jgi:hypothetical protein